MKAHFASLLVAVFFALGVPADASLIVLYDDGPLVGDSNAFYIDGPGAGPFSQSISNGFVATNSGEATSFDFGEWVPTGETPTSVSWALGTSAFGSEISSGSTSQVGFTFFVGNQFSYDVYISHVDGLSGFLSAGSTYYLTLSGGNDSGGNQFVAWDVNKGPATCTFAVGGTPQGGCGDGGETFTIYSDTSVPEPGTLLLLGSGLAGLVGFRRRWLGR